MKKILHIVKAEKISGAENYIFSLLYVLNKKGYKVYLINLKEIKIKYDERFNLYIESLKSNGVEIYQMFIKNKFDVRCVKAIKNIIKYISPDIVHTHMPVADLFGAISAKTLGKSVVSTRHHDYSYSWSQTLKFVLYYSIANLFHDKTIAVSATQKKLITRFELLSKSKVVVIHHGCENTFKDKDKSREKIFKEFNLMKSSILIGTVGRLIDLKGHRYAICAFSKLLQNHKNVHWLIVGEGPEYYNLVRLVKKKELEDRILFLGQRDDIPTLMSAIDVLVHPTTAESFGLVLLEAMLQETPIIASNIGAIPEIVVDGETGFLVAAKNVDALYNMMNKAISDRKQLTVMGKNGRKRYEKNFKLESMFENTVKLYDKILEN